MNLCVYKEPEMHVRKNIHKYNLLEHITFCGWNFKGLDPKNAAESEYPREREKQKRTHVSLWKYKMLSTFKKNVSDISETKRCLTTSFQKLVVSRESCDLCVVRFRGLNIPQLRVEGVQVLRSWAPVFI